MLVLWEAGASSGIYVGETSSCTCVTKFGLCAVLTSLSFVKYNILKTEIISLVSWQVSSRRCVSTAVLRKGGRRDECVST